MIVPGIEADTGSGPIQQSPIHNNNNNTTSRKSTMEKNDDDRSRTLDNQNSSMQESPGKSKASRIQSMNQNQMTTNTDVAVK